MRNARFDLDVALFEIARLYGFKANKRQAARIDLLKASGAWSALEARFKAEEALNAAEFDYRMAMGCLTTEDKQDLARWKTLASTCIGPDGEVYGHRG